jgi:uncharacterized protein (TIGR02284 family)
METSYHENYIKQLQRLLNAVTKSQKKYISASEHIDSADFKNLFNRYAEERNTLISELKDAIEKLGGSVESHEDAEIGAHHWNSTHGSTDPKKDQGVLEKIRNSERDTLDTYDDVLQGSILEEFNLKTLIMSQRLTISDAFTELDKKYFSLFKLSQPY